MYVLSSGYVKVRLGFDFIRESMDRVEIVIEIVIGFVIEIVIEVVIEVVIG